MPNCFQLYRRSDFEAGPVSLNQIDRELCEFMGVECDDRLYAFGWFDWIGFLLAMGKDWNAIRECLPDWRGDNPEAIKVVDWFEENFLADNWAEVGRR